MYKNMDGSIDSESDLVICKDCGEWTEPDEACDSCATSNWLEHKYGDVDPLDEEV